MPLRQGLPLVAIAVVFTTVVATAQTANHSAPAPMPKATACHEWIELHGPAAKHRGRLCHMDVENIGAMEHTKPHEPVVLSVSNNESVLLTSGSSHFRLNRLQLIDANSKNADGQPCPKQPFRRKFNAEDPDADESTSRVFDNMHLTGVAKKSAIGCSYEMIIKHEAGAEVDPHIQIGK